MDRTAESESGTAEGANSVDWVARARDLAPVIAAASDRTERERRVPADVMSAMHDAGLFRLCLPRWLDGGEAPMPTVVRVMEAVAAADASTAWCLGQSQGCALTSAYLDRDVAKEIFGRPGSILAWGPGNSTGRAVPVEGGYRVTGEWRFASGIRNATWLGAHCPAPGPDGTPIAKIMIFPAGEATITDVWDVIGLRGTGSDNYSVTDLFVPAAYSCGRDFAPDRREPGPLYRFNLTTFYGMSFAGVALGIARAILTDFIALAADKIAGNTTTVLRENAAIQQNVALAEARLGSARAYLMESIDAIWHAASAGADLPLDQRARLRIACTFAMNQARDVAAYAYQAAGSTAVLARNPFERRFRDINTVAQQAQAQPVNLEQAGRALLGLDPGGGRL